MATEGSVSSDLRGRIVDGFEIERELGRGGQAVVYRAVQLALGRPVALKVLFLRSVDASSVERFEREAMGIANLDHPHIVPVYGAGKSEGLTYLAMKLVSGPTLADQLGAGSETSIADALDILAQVGEALDFAHGRDVVHRDVKPANILLAESTYAYLSDFGLMKFPSAPGALTTVGTWVGTAAYAAPEQLAGAEATPAADLYSLGVVAFELLTGRRPFEQTDADALAIAHRFGRPPIPSSIVPSLGPGIDEVLGRALAKAPGERYPSAGELVGSLRRSTGSERRRRGPPPPVVTATVKVGVPSDHGTRKRPASEPTVLGVSGSGVWVLNKGDGTVVRIDPECNEVVSRIKVGRNPVALAADADAVWVLCAGKKTLERIDPRSEEVVLSTRVLAGDPVPEFFDHMPGWLQPELEHLDTLVDLATGEGGVWLIDFRAGHLRLVDPASNLVEADLPLEHPLHVAVGEGAVWCACLDQLWRVDPTSREMVEAVTMPSATLAAGAGGVWIGGRGAVKRLDPASGMEMADIPALPNVTDIAVGAGLVWLVSGPEDALAWIDPMTNRLAGTIPIGRVPFAVDVFDGTVWVANRAAATVARVEP